jgi:hypothetical protein
MLQECSDLKFEGVSRMSRFLLSAVSIFAILVVGLLFPLSADARRYCDDRMPLTLLSLYRTSEAIYVGRYEKDEDGKTTEDFPDYSSTLKGEPRKFLTIDDTDYRYKNTETASEGEGEDGHDDGEVYGEIAKPGDSVMLFVSKDEAGTLTLAEMTDGVKKMTQEKAAAYEARIKDLKGILATEKPTHADLVQWMIRNAEDPLTRWEGTFELLQSFQNMDWQEERLKELEAKPNVDPAELVIDGPKDFETGDPGFARSLTDAQKQTLTSILLNRSQSKKTEDAQQPEALADGDRELIELVKRWGDSKVASGLLKQLRTSNANVNARSELMQSIASMLRDETLTNIADEYSSIQWESDDEEIRSESEGETAVEGAAVTASGTSGENTEGEAGPQKKKKTYGELRTEAFGKFMSRANIVIAQERNKRTAKVNR